jgi:Family of unknown function (DUF6069)
MTTNTTQEVIDNRQLAQWTVIAGVAAAVVNSIVFFIAQAMGIFENVAIAMGGNSMAFSVFPVIMSSVLFILVGGGLMWVIARFNARPISTWRIVAIVALVLSFGMPLAPNTFTNATPALLVTLLLMHVIAGVITIYLLTTRMQQA